MGKVIERVRMREVRKAFLRYQEESRERHQTVLDALEQMWEQQEREQEKLSRESPAESLKRDSQVTH